jgi:hypothetical protein
LISTLYEGGYFSRVGTLKKVIDQSILYTGPAVVVVHTLIRREQVVLGSPSPFSLLISTLYEGGYFSRVGTLKKGRGRTRERGREMRNECAEAINQPARSLRTEHVVFIDQSILYTGPAVVVAVTSLESEL